MSKIQLPPILSRHKTSYSCAYDGKIPEARVPLKPSSSSRKHNPQPRHLFLLRMLNRPVCNVRSPPGVKVLPPKSAVALNLVHKTLTTSAKSSYGNPDGHPNFQSIPTRFGSNKLKMIPAKGIVPGTSVEKDTEESTAQILPALVEEPLNMDIKGTKRKLCSAYVLNQHLPQYEAIKDMKARMETSKEGYICQSTPKPSRRKHIQTYQPSLQGSSPLVKSKISHSRNWLPKINGTPRDKTEFTSFMKENHCATLPGLDPTSTIEHCNSLSACL